MSARQVEEPKSLAMRGRILIAALATAVALLVAVAAGPASSANAAPFCSSVTLGPNGQCHLPVGQAGDLVAFNGHGLERAACVALLGYYGEQLDSWVCAKAYTSAWYYMPSWRPFGYYRAAVKNNNMSKSGQFQGNFFCCRNEI